MRRSMYTEYVPGRKSAPLHEKRMCRKSRSDIDEWQGSVKQASAGTDRMTASVSDLLWLA